jgi:hypothetical protein
MNDKVDRELLKIEAVADVLVTVSAGEPAGNTLPTFGAIPAEACERIRERGN